MSWSRRLMSSLDERSAMVPTVRGVVQLGRAGSGPPVLVSHGGPGGFDQGLAWCRHLRDGGCEILAPSRPGYLRTPIESGRDPASQGDLYAAVLDALELERVAVLGFSSGAPSAVHFAARHADRVTALLLDAAIVLPFRPSIGKLRQATFESAPAVWLSYHLAARRPERMTSWMVTGVSRELSDERQRAAVDWIVSDPARLRSVREQWSSIAPRQYRRTGWANDQANEAGLAPLPFGDVAAPTLIAHGSHDAIVPLDHPAAAAAAIPDAEVIVVEEGHHLLSLSRGYEQVALRQLERVHGRAP